MLPMCNIYIRVMNMFVFSFFGLFLTRISTNVSLKGRSGRISTDWKGVDSSGTERSQYLHRFFHPIDSRSVCLRKKSTKEVSSRSLATSSYLSYIHLGSSVCHIPVCRPVVLSSCHIPVVLS